MSRIRSVIVHASLVLVSSALLACGTRAAQEPDSGAPPSAPVEREGDGEVVRVERPEQFPLVTVTSRRAASSLSATGVISPDVARAVPVTSLASGRVVDLQARLGDHVRQGQVLVRIHSSDASAAFSDYRKAVADQTVAQTQLERATSLYQRGATARKDLEVAQGVATKAGVDVETAAERLRVLGLDARQAPTAIMEVRAPASGVITEQNVTSGAGVKSLDNSPNLFTIADLSRVWILCDVHENDLAAVRLGDTADLHVNAYPDRLLHGRIGNIGEVLDPSLRTARIRLEVANPGFLRVGMFVTATFHGQTAQVRAVVPAEAILHLHDRDWVFLANAPGQFRRVEVTTGEMLPGRLQEVVSGLAPGQRIAAKALVLNTTLEQ
jgi:membrane fusion protein, heavy metal efflux system